MEHIKKRYKSRQLVSSGEAGDWFISWLDLQSGRLWTDVVDIDDFNMWSRGSWKGTEKAETTAGPTLLLGSSTYGRTLVMKLNFDIEQTIPMIRNVDNFIAKTP